MEFDALRIALLVIGIAIVVGVYLWSTFAKRGEPRQRVRREPALKGTDASFEGDLTSPYREEPTLTDPPLPVESKRDPLIRDEPPESEEAGDEVPILYDEIFKTPKPGEPSDVIVVNVFARSGQRFAGPDLKAALEASGMAYGAMRIYHRMDESGDRLFSLVNSVEPGYFEPERFDGFSTPGISLFLALPGPARPAAALEELVATAQSLSRQLDGRLLDQDRNPLHGQGIEHLRERVREFERQQRLASAQS
ncbi:MAG: hypothetical protein Kow006_28320 [Gammaproteobacteria bacterium]